MTKSQIHNQAFGYELNAIKPVHLANGFFLALTGKHYRLEWLNKLAVISHKKGLKDEYETSRLHEVLLNEKSAIAPSVDIEALGLLRKQVNAIASNDDAVYAAFDDYRAFGNDYTISGPNLLCDQKRKDGYAGYFLFRVFEESDPGRRILELAKEEFNKPGDSLATLLRPVLDKDEEGMEWDDNYEEKLGELTPDRIAGISLLMEKPTSAISEMLRNSSRMESRYSFLRQLVTSLGIWLSLYLVREAAAAASLAESPLFFCDFTGNASKKCRARSSNCFSRHRELVYRSFQSWHDSGRIMDLDPFRNQNTGNLDLKDIERHFSDLTVRVGIAQPRASSVRAKHYELQPDTTRTLVMSVLEQGDAPITFPELASRLRDVWAIAFGGCNDDSECLARQGIVGLDEDDDLGLNRNHLIRQLKILGLAFEPSDGLVLCSLELGEVR